VGVVTVIVVVGQTTVVNAAIRIQGGREIEVLVEAEHDFYREKWQKEKNKK
jgi:hypothetical protein